MSYYRLELCPTAEGRVYYSSKDIAENTNAGFDLFVARDYDVLEIAKAEKPHLLDLGTAARMVRVWPDGREEDVHYWLCPRSSIYKTGLVMANSQGVIDASYRGTLKAPVWCVSPKAFLPNFDGAASRFEGMRLFQIVAPDMGWIREVRVVESLSETSRGAGGFGSTGR
jgi:dUTPase